MKRVALASIPILAGLLLPSGCDLLRAPRSAPPPEVPGEARRREVPPRAMPAPIASTPRNAYFGDLHVHTLYSFDAFVFGTRARPDDAYRFGKGEALRHPAGFEMKLREPLDFLAVTDHAVFLGMASEMDDPSTEAGKLPIASKLRAAKTPAERAGAFRELVALFRGDRAQELVDPEVARLTWKETIAAAERHNDPGRFTTFIGYEYTSAPEFQNLHRNVIFRGSRAPEMPFSAMDSPNPEDLWRWMDDLRDREIEALAIPHNSNASNGQMFKLADWAGNPLDDAYATRRLRNEPVIEITQVKGTSETHPSLSPGDEWGGFEIMPFRIASELPSEPAGGYARDALLRGLTIAERGVVNPYRFGFIGSSDTHVGAGAFDESDYWSKVGIVDADGKLRGSVPVEFAEDGKPRYAPSRFDSWGASGLAAVWAEENTRDAIYEALRRKETFATTGPRIRVRFFASFGFGPGLLEDPDPISRAYERGVPMGGDLIGGDGFASPTFFAWAIQDPDHVPLQRVQIVKGWIENGEPRERIHDVACSDGLQVDPDTHRCPDNGAEVDLADCSVSAGVGAGELAAVWTDPDFDPRARAFYYVRVLENPTCRWSTWDALRAGTPAREDLPATIQERAWASPIWYTPGT